MATKKSKTSSKSEKTKTTKSKTTVKSTVKTEHAAPKTHTVVSSTTTATTSKKSCLSGFFARKYEPKEGIFTVFKNPKFYGALLGEILGTMLLALLLFSVSLMGIASLATYAFAVIAVLVAVYAFSGACLNPIVVIGMMASRRMSVIRGVMYVIAEVIGAWLGWLIFNGFHLAGGETAYDIPTITEVGEGQFWIFAMIELLGAIIIAFFYARALSYKRSVFTFAAVITGGMTLAIIVGYVASAAFLSLNNNFIMNPAVAMMLQIFPTAGESFGEILGGICQALSIYVILPMIGGVAGFYLSDFTSKLSGEE
ncbi:aquaporin [Candidatus Saccharibacteria bacterium]|nr:aquaporin [Candidatus Saccharibacteria bacterium]